MTVSFRSPDPGARPGWRPTLEILRAALAAADPEAAVRGHLTRDGHTLDIIGTAVDLDDVLIKDLYLLDKKHTRLSPRVPGCGCFSQY